MQLLLNDCIYFYIIFLIIVYAPSNIVHIVVHCQVDSVRTHVSEWNVDKISKREEFVIYKLSKPFCIYTISNLKCMYAIK